MSREFPWKYSGKWVECQAKPDGTLYTSQELAEWGNNLTKQQAYDVWHRYSTTSRGDRDIVEWMSRHIFFKMADKRQLLVLSAQVRLKYPRVCETPKEVEA